MGIALAGRPKTSSRSLLQSSAVMSYNNVREALPASLRCSAPPVSRQISQESTVPTRTSPTGTPFGKLSNNHRIFGAENIASTGSPVRVLYQLPILIIDRLDAPVRRAAVLPADQRA